MRACVRAWVWVCIYVRARSCTYACVHTYMYILVEQMLESRHVDLQYLHTYNNKLRQWKRRKEDRFFSNESFTYEVDWSMGEKKEFTLVSVTKRFDICIEQSTKYLNTSNLHRFDYFFRSSHDGKRFASIRDPGTDRCWTFRKTENVTGTSSSCAKLLSVHWPSRKLVTIIISLILSYKSVISIKINYFSSTDLGWS